MLDLARIRADFPGLNAYVGSHPLIYCDSAATAATPIPVVAAMNAYYLRYCANVHRGVHPLAQIATERYEAAREIARRFLGAADRREVVFCRGTTEGINLVAQTYGRQQVRRGDVVVITEMEHHSNIVPWQMLCRDKGAVLRVIPMGSSGIVDLQRVEDALRRPRTRLLAVTWVSNALGTCNPIHEIVQIAHRRGVPVLVDAAQAAPHLPIDVQAMGVDWLVLSGHKVYGPTGIGVLYGRLPLLSSMPAWQGGGDMVRDVQLHRSECHAPPAKFEAGTPHIAGAIGLAAAFDYLTGIGWPSVVAHERLLVQRAEEGFSRLSGVRVLPPRAVRVGLVSIALDRYHCDDIAQAMSNAGIAIRSGHHCARLVCDRLCVPGTARFSFGLYNTVEEVDACVQAVGQLVSRRAA